MHRTLRRGQPPLRNPPLDSTSEERISYTTLSEHNSDRGDLPVVVECPSARGTASAFGQDPARNAERSSGAPGSGTLAILLVGFFGGEVQHDALTTARHA